MLTVKPSASGGLSEVTSDELKPLSCSSLVTRHSSVILEVEPQRELYLSVRAEADGALDGLSEQAEGRSGG